MSLGKRKTYAGQWMSANTGKFRRTRAGNLSRVMNAAVTIAANPRLRGYARTYSRYSGKYRYGRQQAELKFLDTATSFTFDTTGEVPATGQLNLIPQGVGESERIGRKVIIKSIQCRWRCVPNTTNWIGGVLRLMLVQDTQCNGAAATYSGVGGVLEDDTVTAFRNLENTSRFIIHKDWLFSLTPKAGVVGAFNTESRVVQFYKKCSIPIEFDSVAATGALTTIRSNNLFLLARSSVDDDVVQCLGVVRIRYLDT